MNIKRLMKGILTVNQNVPCVNKLTLEIVWGYLSVS